MKEIVVRHAITVFTLIGFSISSALANFFVTPASVPSNAVNNNDLSAHEAQSHSVWVAKAGDTLRKSVSQWANKAGWKIHWIPSDLDYSILGDLTYTGTFENAVREIFTAYEQADRPLWVKGNVKQRLLVISERK